MMRKILSVIGTLSILMIPFLRVGGQTPGDVLVDLRDGQQYRTVYIGDQLWMAQNINFGGTAKTCYDHDYDNCVSYGALYDWDEAQEACPATWHLPSQAEWTELSEYLGIEQAGQKLKASPEDSIPWDGTNETGFAALPAGAGNGEGFHRKGDWALFWSSSESDSERAWFAQLDGFWYTAPAKYTNLYLGSYYLKSNQFSVRCIEDPDEKSELQAPNILCLVCEDISPFLGCYGDPVAITPNLDRLASEGIRYTRMYSVSGVCAPSRNALITGMYPTSIGGNNMRTGNKMKVENVPDSLQLPPYESTPPAYVKCYSEYMRAAGYYCTNNSKEDYQFKAPKSAWDESGNKAHWRNRPEGKPFFAIFNFNRSHESQIWTWEQEPWIIHPDSVELPPFYPDTPKVRRDLARMHSNNTIMDREVQEMIDLLEADGLLENTIIIFYSDHGGPMPRGKRELLESGTLVPFIVRFPGGKAAGTVVNELCSFVDIPATILSLAGVAVPDYMHGQAFLGEQKALSRDYIFSARDRMDEWFDCRRAVRDQRYRYVKNYRPDLGAYLDLRFRKAMNTMQELLIYKDAGSLNEEQSYWFRTEKKAEELYDLESDRAYSDVQYKLAGVLDEWITGIDDKGIKYRTEKELMLSMWPNGCQPATALPNISIEEGEVVIACATEGASMVYQVDGEGYSPHHWHLYTGPIQQIEGQTVTAIAHRIGYSESKVATLNILSP